MNKVWIQGNVGSSETRTMPSGKSVINFSVATSETWKDKEGKPQKRTEWHKCVYFPFNDENISINKGDQVFVDGKSVTRSYEKDGQKRYITEIQAAKVYSATMQKDIPKEEPMFDAEGKFDAIPF